MGIATGAPGPDVVDVDDHGERGNGFAALNRLKREGLVENPGAIVRTPGGGLHLYFTAVRAAPRETLPRREHIDLRARGGYVVAPPSRSAAAAMRWSSTRPVRPRWISRAIRSLLDPQPERRGWQPPRRRPPAKPGHLAATSRSSAD